MITRSCEQCGKQAKIGRRRAFCSERCRWTWHNRNRTLPKNIKGNCAVCGKRFARTVMPHEAKKWPGRFCGRTCAGKWRSGKNHPLWNGGRHESRGYVYVYAPSGRKTYQLEHRLVMERIIGRRLRTEEVVHHKNGDGTDNRPSNLRLFTNNAEHKKHEHRARERDGLGQYRPLRRK